MNLDCLFIALPLVVLLGFLVWAVTRKPGKPEDEQSQAPMSKDEQGWWK